MSKGPIRNRRRQAPIARIRDIVNQLATSYD
jgi:hypothetical protein